MNRDRGLHRLPNFSLAACVLMAGFVLGLWGCAGTSPAPGSTSRSRPQLWRPAVPDTNGPVVAVVGTRRITRHDIDSILITAPQAVQDQFTNSLDQYRQLVQRIAEQEMLYQAAVQAGTESDPAYRAEAAGQARQTLMKHYYKNGVKALPALPDSAVRGYYEAHLSDFKIPARARARHIQLATRVRADQVLKRLKAGGAWDALCARYSTDKVSAKSGGVIGYLVSDADVIPGIGSAPAIVAAAFRLKEGETSEPLKTERGWHLIRVDQSSPAGEQKFEDVEKQIRSNLEGDREEGFQKTLIDSLKQRFGTTVFEDSLDRALQPSKSPADLFAAAQSAGSASERIELFRKVVERYPKEKAAAQAQFMIGFTYAEELTEYPKARDAFREFLKRYPNSDLVESAKWMMENMESSDLPPGIGAPGDTTGVILTPGNPGKGSGSEP